MSTTMTVEAQQSDSAQHQQGGDCQHKASHVDKHGYLFGQKLAASMSPFLHSVIYKHLGLNWEQTRLDSTDMDLFLRLIRDPDFYGASVTMPHKVAIISHLDELEPECRAVGACNTIFLRTDPETGRRLFCGTNTDVIGVRDAFLYNVADPKKLANSAGLVIGGGGAARSAVYALHHWLGCKEVYLVNRDKSEVDAVISECSARGFGSGLIHVSSTDQAESLSAPGAIVACVPDYPPKTQEEILARKITEVFLGKESKGAMLEMCYNPSPYTALGALAEQNGWQVILGTEALIYQGLEQDRYWTGLDRDQLPVDEVKQAIAVRLAERLEKSKV